MATPSGAIVIDRLSAELVDELADVIGVDMPIGLPIDRPRSADTSARHFLRPRGSTVFPTPPRVCLGSETHAEAVRRARAATGQGVSIQAFNLLGKIAELDALVSPDNEHRIREIHPECSFALLNGGTPLPPKRTPAGHAQRRLLLAAHFDLPPTPSGAAPDDLLDAYAVLWSAQRVAVGEAMMFAGADGDERDARGLLMRITA